MLEMGRRLFKRREREFKRRVLEIAYGIALAFGSEEAQRLFVDDREKLLKDLEGVQ